MTEVAALANVAAGAAEQSPSTPDEISGDARILLKGKDSDDAATLGTYRRDPVRDRLAD